jgi:myosin-18
MFRGCKSEDMPPHIYSLAQSAYHGMLASRRDHSIVLLGRSGSGKTTNCKHILHYLVLAAGAVNKVCIVCITTLQTLSLTHTHTHTHTHTLSLSLSLFMCYDLDVIYSAFSIQHRCKAKLDILHQPHVIGVGSKT